MTFAEYNTDKNFDNNNSSLEELVNIGVSEGKSDKEIKNALSPKWQKSKKIGEFDSYYQNAIKNKPKEEPKKEPSADDAVGLKALGAINGGVAAPVSNPPEKKKEEEAPEVEKAVEETVEEDDNLTAPALSKGDEKYIKDQRDRADNAEVRELNKIDDRADYNYKKMYDSIARTSDAYKHIDDKLIAQLPTFMFKRYLNDEFGDHKSTDAKLRLAHFLINGVGTALQNASAAIKGGPTQESDIQKYNRTNLEQGLENRWKKYKAETDNAIALASKETMSEQEARHAVEQLTRNQNMNTVWNTMNENQKLYAMEVTKKIGDFIGNMDISELADFIAGAAYEGKMDKDKVVAIGIAKLAEKFPDVINNLPEGNIKDMVFSFLPGVSTGIGGALGGGKKDKEDNPETTLEDGTNIDAGKIMTNADYDKIAKAAEDLGNKYYNGEIDEEKFRNEYGKLEAEMKKHGIYNKARNIKSADAYIKQIAKNKLTELSGSFYDLNDNAKKYTKDEYLKMYDDLKSQAVKWGISEKDLKSIEKEKEKALKKTKK